MNAMLVTKVLLHVDDLLFTMGSNIDDTKGRCYTLKLYLCR